MQKKIFEYPSENELNKAVVSIEYLWGKLFVIKHNRPDSKVQNEVWRDLFSRAITEGFLNGAELIGIRLRSDYYLKDFQDVLKDLSFKKVSGRIEFKTNVEKLPHFSGTPFIWKSAAELKWEKKDLVIFIEKIISGALDIDPDEKAEDFIQDWIHHSEYTHGLDCIWIGFLSKQEIALCVVQIEPASGWSRISYMGLIPDYRGKNLGKWVHRHGIEMIKKVGGKLYHGGTHIDNVQMRKLFELHNCEFFCELEEWALKK